MLKKLKGFEGKIRKFPELSMDNYPMVEVYENTKKEIYSENVENIIRSYKGKYPNTLLCLADLINLKNKIIHEGYKGSLYTRIHYKDDCRNTDCSQTDVKCCIAEINGLFKKDDRVIGHVERNIGAALYKGYDYENIEIQSELSADKFLDKLINEACDGQDGRSIYNGFLQ